jgi:hypothetical protein
MELSKLHFDDGNSCEALTASIMSLPSSDRRERRVTYAQNEMLSQRFSGAICCVMIPNRRTGMAKVAECSEFWAACIERAGVAARYL